MYMYTYDAGACCAISTLNTFEAINSILNVCIKSNKYNIELTKRNYEVNKPVNCFASLPLMVRLSCAN